jgi:hypothetical protein
MCMGSIFGSLKGGIWRSRRVLRQKDMTIVDGRVKGRTVIAIGDSGDSSGDDGDGNNTLVDSTQLKRCDMCRGRLAMCSWATPGGA